MPKNDGADSHDSEVSSKHMESEDRLDLDDDNDPEETLEEKVEYEEVEEEEEVEEIEEVIEIEVDEDEENEYSDAGDIEEQAKQKHAELLALPHHGSEVYLGGIPTDVSEEDLKGFCQSVGEVTLVRIMKEKVTGEGKGYAFVTFRDTALALKAIEKLNNSEFKGRKIKCSTTQAKHRLFIGNVPRNWAEVDMINAVSDVGPGVESVKLPKDPQDSSMNHGFAFVDYYNQACAEYSKEKMSNRDFKLDENAPTVSWAEHRNADSSAASQVRALYIKNLPKDITQDRLKALFERHGNITKVVIPPAKPGKEQSRYGFVHYADRSSTMKALNKSETYEIDGRVLDCSLAKSQADQKFSGGLNSQLSTLHPNYHPLLGYGMAGASYGAFGAGLGAAGFAQPLMHAGGLAAGGMTMMPILLPDGRIGYVLQQPGVGVLPPLPIPPRRSPPSRSGRAGSGGGKRSSDSDRGSSSDNDRGRSSDNDRGRSSDKDRGHSRYKPY